MQLLYHTLDRVAIQTRVEAFCRARTAASFKAMPPLPTLAKPAAPLPLGPDGKPPTTMLQDAIMSLFDLAIVGYVIPDEHYTAATQYLIRALFFGPDAPFKLESALNLWNSPAALHARFGGIGGFGIRSVNA